MHARMRLASLLTIVYFVQEFMTELLADDCWTGQLDSTSVRKIDLCFSVCHSNTTLCRDQWALKCVLWPISRNSRGLYGREAIF